MSAIASAIRSEKPLSTHLARKLGQAVVATALLGSLMGYGAATGNADTVEWPTGVSVR